MPVFTCECCNRVKPNAELAKGTGLPSIKICVRCDDELTRAEKAHQTNGGSY